MPRLFLAFVATVALLAISAGPATAKPWSDAEPTGTIVDVAVGASGTDGPDADGRDYDLLIAAVEATGLLPALSSGEWTVFAPNDRAFQKLVAEITGAEELPSEGDALAAVIATFSPGEITEILLYHVIAGETLGPIDVLTAGSLTMADGGTVEPRGFRLVDESPQYKDPRLVLKAIDLHATNGVIHTIDRVLVPAL